FDEACKRIEAAGAEVVGLNCSRGPWTMLPLLAQIRNAVDCHVAAQPVPYRTTEEQPTFQLLRTDDGGRAFPIALDPHVHTRFEMAACAAGARDRGVGYSGLGGGGAPPPGRARAGRLGRTGPASRYSPDLSLHPVIGDDDSRSAKYPSWQE